MIINMNAVYASEPKLAQAGFQFLKMDMATRAAGMGGSYITVNNDASAMFYNPAGLAYMEPKLDLFISHTQWIADIAYLGGGVAVNLGNWGTVGASWMTADYGEIIGTIRSDYGIGYVETGQLDVGAYSFGLSYAKSLTDKFSIGGQIKYCHQSLGQTTMDPSGTIHTNSLSTLAYDFGTIYYPGFKSFRFGMVIRNFAPELSYEIEKFELPITFTIGASMDVLDLFGQHENSIVMSVDAVHPRDYTERLNIGTEYTLMKTFSLRAGYKFNYDNEGLTAGFGFKQKLANCTLDFGYAYQPMTYFNAVHRLSFGFSY